MLLLCLHNIVHEKTDTFDKKCSRISMEEFGEFLHKTAEKFRLVSFSHYLSLLRSGKTEPGIVALTFDDGFHGVFTHAFPMLQAHGIDAAVFINPPFLAPSERVFHFLEIEIAFRVSILEKVHLDFLGKDYSLADDKLRVKAMKDVKRFLKAIPDDSRTRLHTELLATLGVPAKAIQTYARTHEKYHVMSAHELQLLRSAGWCVAAHTMSHRAVGMLEEAQIREEMHGAKVSLEALMGEPCPIFAYPYGEEVHIGEVAPRVAQAVGFEMAFTTIPPEQTKSESRFLLPRIDYKEFMRDYL